MTDDCSSSQLARSAWTPIEQPIHWSTNFVVLNDVVWTKADCRITPVGDSSVGDLVQSSYSHVVFDVLTVRESDGLVDGVQFPTHRQIAGRDISKIGDNLGYLSGLVH